MNISAVISNYKQLLGSTVTVYFSPGRVNLIGEHIDYLGGRVLPTAISLGIYAIVSQRSDQLFHFTSYNFPDVPSVVVAMDDLNREKERGWVNYPVGMIDAFVRHGMTMDHGLNIVIAGNLPNGAGLSSSASLEVLMGIVLEDQYNHPMDRIKLVQLAKQVENEYVGVNCGIMDQFAVGMSKQDHAIYLDTDSLEYDFVPITLHDHALVIANSNVKRGLIDSKYNERRRECDEGLSIIQTVFPSVGHLCAVSLEQFGAISNQLPTNIRRRVRHAITEHQRTQAAVQALREDDINRFGLILNAGHASLRDDYEVTCRELDILQESFLRHGALGARMTGGGFGGCVIAILPKTSIIDIQTNVQQDYYTQTNIHADFYVCDTSDGAKRLTKEEWT